MLKYFKRQKSHGDSINKKESDHLSNKTKVNHIASEISTNSHDGDSSSIAHEAKRHSLRSTTSFCDEVFLEELAGLGLMTTNVSCTEEDTISYSGLSLGALSNRGSNHTGSAANSVVEFDEDLFKYHSRLSMCITSIISDPNCLSYFVQYLEKRNALPLIKFYLDINNFKNAALAQLRNEKKHKLLEEEIPEESTDGAREEYQAECNNNTDDHIIENKHHQLQLCNDLYGANTTVVCHSEKGSNSDNIIVPELKTLCDLTMRKPLTDDEKSQIYAATNRNLAKCDDKNNFNGSSELSLCSLNSSFTDVSECVIISTASVQDALAIYQKYLSPKSAQYIELPVDVLSKISLVLCKNEHEKENCSITSDCFIEAQQCIMNKLENQFLNDFLESTYYGKYCVELIQGDDLNINDVLHSEVTLFYLMEYLEQHHERDCLEFWSSAVNYRKSYLSQEPHLRDEKEAQLDAMIIYEKYFSLQTELKLWSSNKLRSHVERCICTEDLVFYCFDLPLKVTAKYLECKYLKLFLKSPLFANYLNELKTRTEEHTGEPKETIHKPLLRSFSDKISSGHRKGLSDCTLDKKLSISQHNTLLASMDNHSIHLKEFQLNIESSQLTNPNLLWHRSNSNNLKFGRVNSLGRYERDFMSPADVLHHSSSQSSHNWYLNRSRSKIKNVMRKLVHLPDDNVQEEIAWQVAEMIVKDVTSVTMRKEDKTNSSEPGQKS